MEDTDKAISGGPEAIEGVASNDQGPSDARLAQTSDSVVLLLSEKIKEILDDPSSGSSDNGSSGPAVG